MKKIALMALCLTAFASSANASIVSIEYKGNVSYSNISGVVAGQEYTETFSWDYSLFALDIGSNYRRYMNLCG